MMSKRTASSASGFWLALPQAVLMLMVARQGRSRSAIAETKRVARWLREVGLAPVAGSLAPSAGDGQGREEE